MSAATHLAGASRRWLLWGYLAALSVAELVTAAVSPHGGLVIHVLLLMGLLAHSGLGPDAAERRLALGLTLAPLIRLLSLGLPLTNLPQLAWYPIVSAPLLAATWLIIQQLRVSRAELGLRPGNLPAQLAITGIGVGLGVVEYVILRPEPLLASFSWAAFALAAVVLLVATGFTEELIFRGLLQSLGGPALGRPTLVYVSLLFAVLHIGYLSALDVAFVFAAGLLFAAIVRWSGSILGVTLAHGMTNITLFLLMPQLNEQAPGAVRDLGPWVIWGGVALAAVALGALRLRAVAARIAAIEGAASAPELRVLRRGSGLTYIGLAQRTGLPARLIAEIESGLRLPRPEELSRLAQALGVAPQALGPAARAG